jgi:acyl carrier protein
MNTTAFESELLKLIGRCTQQPAVTPQDRLRENLAVDSMGFIRLVIEIERAFGVRFEDNMLTIDLFGTVADLTKYLQTLTERTAAKQA